MLKYQQSTKKIVKKSLAGLFIALGAINVIQCTALAEVSERISRQLISEINSEQGNFEKKYDELRQKEGPLWMHAQIYGELPECITSAWYQSSKRMPHATMQFIRRGPSRKGFIIQL